MADEKKSVEAEFPTAGIYSTKGWDSIQIKKAGEKKTIKGAAINVLENQGVKVTPGGGGSGGA
jgi:predicted metalloenzyme YecM